MIALLTDFGQDDPYAGQLRVVLAAAAPGVALVDLCHGVRPFDVRQAGFFAFASAPWLPAGAVLLAVVDPGVGSARRLVLLEWRGRWLLGPDNGLFGLLLGDVARAWDVTPATPASAATFHGRDVLAPLAARLALGGEPAALGRPVALEALVRAPWSRPRPCGAGLEATVLHVDRYGNCLLNLPLDEHAPRFPPDSTAVLRVAGSPALPVRTVRCYAALREGDVGLIPGSQGVLELAVDQGSAAVRLGLAPGDAVTLEPGGGT